MLKTIFLLTAILLCVSNASAQTADLPTKQVAWALGHNLSLAAIGHAEGAPKATVESLIAKAKANGNKFGVVIPDLPVNTRDKTSNRAEALIYLLHKVGKPMGGILRKNFDEEHALLFEISLKSNLLIMLYVPGEKEPQTIANVIKTRSERIGLPSHLSANLLKLIAANASFEKVKESVFKMHGDTATYLAKPK